MNKIIMFFLAGICSVMSIAQTTPTGLWKYSNHFPELPPFSVVFDISIFQRSMPHLVQMTLDNKQDKDTASCQSVILRHKEQKMESQYHFKYRPDYSKMVDNLGDIRDRIVRERRVKEGKPLQPLPPMPSSSFSRNRHGRNVIRR